MSHPGWPWHCLPCFVPQVSAWRRDTVNQGNRDNGKGQIVAWAVASQPLKESLKLQNRWKKQHPPHSQSLGAHQNPYILQCDQIQMITEKRNGRAPLLLPPVVMSISPWQHNDIYIFGKKIAASLLAQTVRQLWLTAVLEPSIKKPSFQHRHWSAILWLCVRMRRPGKRGKHLCLELSYALESPTAATWSQQRLAWTQLRETGDSSKNPLSMYSVDFDPDLF